MTTFRNPIIPGFNPDPSICRVGEDYYLVTSSFEYFPGVPIFHSRDLVHWRQLGHVLDQPSQLNLDGTPSSKGIYAATLRYNKGVFYMITTFVESATGARRNFYVTSGEPQGPWSDPVWLPEAPGIDSSLFFDDDGRCYVSANRRPPEGQQYPKHMEIWLQELDLESEQLVGPKYSLWDGAMKFIHAQEGPHIYKKDGWYYLLIAEGGTGHTHSITVARSKSLTGPYEGCKQNPILTHRHLGRGHGIVNVGHGDLVETQTGEWWMVCLGSRPYGGYYRNMGRESFLVPVIWEEGWPVVNPGKGMVELEGKRPDLPKFTFPSEPVCDHFDEEKLRLDWAFLRTPRGGFWSLEERPGFLRLRLKPEALMDTAANPAFVCRRQQHAGFAIRTAMEFLPLLEKDVAGIALLENENYQFRMEVSGTGGDRMITLVERRAGEDRQLAARHLGGEGKRLYMKVEAVGQSLRFAFAGRSEAWETLAEGVDATLLSVDVAGGFTGTMLGLYASSQGAASEGYADFDYFEYAPLADV